MEMPLQPDAAQKPFGLNQHVADAIKDYCRFDYSQQFALLITGKWGSGKTFLLKAVEETLIERHLSGDRNKPIYVTLYGVRNSEEIGEQLFQQSHPLLGSKGARIVGAILKGLVKTSVKIDLAEINKGSVSLGSQLPDLKVSELIDSASQRIIIFDDFERAKMPASEILGYINPLVEHDGCKVLILGNESEIKDEAYVIWKEKTVGQTLKVVADVDMAFKTFLDNIATGDLRSFYETHSKQIGDIFRDSGLENLRLLKQFLWDFERYWAVLSLEQRKNTEAMTEVMSLLLAYTLEVRSGRIDRILDQNQIMQYRVAQVIGKTQENHHLEMIRRYSSVVFTSRLITNQIIQDIVLNSLFEQDPIRTSLNNHPYFTTLEKLPSWRALWFGYEANVEEIAEICVRFKEDFDQRKFSDIGVMLHAFGLCIWLSKIQSPDWCSEPIIPKIKLYIDDFFRGKVSTLNDLIADSFFDKNMGAYGLAFRAADDPDFELIFVHLKNTLIEWRLKAAPLVSVELLSVMSTDPDTFLRKVCYTESGPSTYARLPVLCNIEVEDFCEKLISLAPKDRLTILSALSIRYESVSTNHPIVGEFSWLKDVHAKLVAHADTLPPVPRAFFLERVKMYFDRRTPLNN
jgi:hypothetical protein